MLQKYNINDFKLIDMEATELRIGNYIVYNGGQPEDIDEFTVIEVQDIAWVQQKNEEFNKYHSPIPLTEEWLLKFKFEDCGCKPNEYYEKDDIYYVHKINKEYEFGIIYPCEINHRVDLKNIKYVHQLQNLYFALTGEERTIN